VRQSGTTKEEIPNDDRAHSPLFRLPASPIPRACPGLAVGAIMLLTACYVDLYAQEPPWALLPAAFISAFCCRLGFRPVRGPAALSVVVFGAFDRAFNGVRMAVAASVQPPLAPHAAAALACVEQPICRLAQAKAHQTPPATAPDECPGLAAVAQSAVTKVVLAAMKFIGDQMDDTVFPCKHFSSSFLM